MLCYAGLAANPGLVGQRGNHREPSSRLCHRSWHADFHRSASAPLATPGSCLRTGYRRRQRRTRSHLRADHRRRGEVLGQQRGSGAITNSGPCPTTRKAMLAPSFVFAYWMRASTMAGRLYKTRSVCAPRAGAHDDEIVRDSATTSEGILIWRRTQGGEPVRGRRTFPPRGPEAVQAAMGVQRAPANRRRAPQPPLT